ncbi:MAG: tetratricopeptide repeat protein [Alphaproteobacteria bacterium]
MPATPKQRSGWLAFVAALLVLAACTTAPEGEEEAFNRGVQAYAAGDYETVLKEWLPLAEGGHRRAQYNLGLMYDDGQGVDQDDAKAVYWYRKAAESGHDGAQNNLGLMYASGQGVRRDDVEAVAWWRKAAEQGYAKAQYNLGVMYLNGWGTPRDLVQAHKWFDLAAASYPPGGDRDEVTRQRDELAKAEMTPAEVEEAQRLAREWTAARSNGAE